jgi:serine/threonine protein kinase
MEHLEGRKVAIPSTISKSGEIRYMSSNKAENQEASFLIMRRYDMDLMECYKTLENGTKFENTMHFAREILLGFQIIHNAGYVYNDLTPKNIMV